MCRSGHGRRGCVGVDAQRGERVVLRGEVLKRRRRPGRSVIASERRSLAELLASLADEQWQTPSLCASWRVRDVAAHVALVPTAPGLLALIGGVVKAGGNPNRYNHDLAVRHANRPTAVIVAELRDHADSRKLSAPTTAPNLALVRHPGPRPRHRSTPGTEPADAARHGS